LVNGQPPVDQVVSLENVEGVWVAVEPAQGGKCERCWIIDTSVPTEEGKPALCSRCTEVVGTLES